MLPFQHIFSWCPWVCMHAHLKMWLHLYFWRWLSAVWSLESGCKNKSEWYFQNLFACVLPSCSFSCSLYLWYDVMDEVCHSTGWPNIFPFEAWLSSSAYCSIPYNDMKKLIKIKWVNKYPWRQLFLWLHQKYKVCFKGLLSCKDTPSTFCVDCSDHLCK